MTTAKARPVTRRKASGAQQHSSVCWLFYPERTKKVILCRTQSAVSDCSLYNMYICGGRTWRQGRAEVHKDTSALYCNMYCLRRQCSGGGQTGILRRWHETVSDINFCLPRSESIYSCKLCPFMCVNCSVTSPTLLIQKTSDLYTPTTRSQMDHKLYFYYKKECSWNRYGSNSSIISSHHPPTTTTEWMAVWTRYYLIHFPCISVCSNI